MGKKNEMKTWDWILFKKHYTPYLELTDPLLFLSRFMLFSPIQSRRTRVEQTRRL